MIKPSDDEEEIPEQMKRNSARKAGKRRTEKEKETIAERPVGG